MVEFDISGGAICLDFANTWGNRLDPSADRLSTIDDLLEWAYQAGYLSSPERRDLESLARQRPVEAGELFHRAIEIREIIFRVFSSSAAGMAHCESDVDDLNRALVEVPRQLLRSTGECWRWHWPAGDDDIARVMWPVIQSAADLVTSSEMSRVRECAAPDCCWLFLESGRGRGRRWCDMGTCGNRAKARRYYERHHGKSPSS